MILNTTQSHDGIEIQYAVTEIKIDKPWISLVIPFGLSIHQAKNFFEFFSSHYNVVAWETRSILESSDRKPFENEFSLSQHIKDMLLVLSTNKIHKSTLIGYCSGAGIALGAASRAPDLFEHLILVHGEYAMLDEENFVTDFSREVDSLLSMAASDEARLNLIFDKIKDQRFDIEHSRPSGIDLPFTQLNYFRRHAANYASYKANDFRELARIVSHKTLVMAGNLDVQTNVASSQKICELLSNSSIYIDLNADHYGMLREDSATMVAIWNYLYEQMLHQDRKYPVHSKTSSVV